MRMKKLLMFLVLLTVSVGTWAGVTWTKLADSNSQVSNGKGFMYDHTAYLIDVDNPGDLSSANITAIPEAGNEYNTANMNTGTYFVFTGELSAADLAKLDASFGSSSNDVYFDFSGATFSNNVSIANLSSSTLAKYIILPNNTTSIPSADSDYPSSVKEVMAVNTTDGKFLSYSDPTSSQTMEKLLAFDNRFKNAAITDYTLVGTYSHNETTFPASAQTMYNSIFTLLITEGGGGYQYNIVNLDLTNARFPNYGTTNTYKINVTIMTSTGEEKQVEVERIEDTNALESLFLYGQQQKLESVLLPKTTETEMIPYHAFYNCTKLTTLEIPGNIKYLGLAAFEGCSGLTSLIFNEGLEEMSSNVFYNCSNLPTINLPVGLENIGEYAFTNCLKITSITLPEGVKKIQNGAFEYTNIASIRLPSTLEYIEDNAFRQCNSLTSITFPKNLKSIGSNCFWNCNKLTDVYFLSDDPNNIPIVPANAFGSKAYNCNNSCFNVRKTDTRHYNYGDYELSRKKPENVDDSHQYKYEINWNSWQSSDAAGYHAAVLHYPLVTRDAEYSPEPINNVQAYIDAQSVTVPDLYYTEDNGETYKKLNGTPTSGVTYYTRSTQGAGTYTSTNTSEPGITQYYSDQNGTAAAIPYVGCNNGVTYYVKNGTDNVYAGPVYEPQKVNGQWINSYYVKSYSGNTYTPSDMFFSNTVYHSPVTNENAPIYASRDNHFIQGVEHWYSDNNGTNEVVITFPNWDNVYIEDAESETGYKITTTTVRGVGYYYRKASDGNYYLFGLDKDDNILNNDKFNNGSDWYWSGSEYYLKGYGTKTDYSSTDHWIPSVTTYYSDENGTVLHDENSTSWPGGCFKNVTGYSEGYYYISGTTPHYDSACDVAYDPTKTYYTDNSGTEASSVQFDQTYYYENTTYAYTQVPTSTIDQIILKQTSLYAKDGDTYTKVNAEDVDASGTYYLCTVEGSDDVLGEYYTVPERNATYGGVWVGEDTPEGRHNIDGAWPCDQDLSAWLGDNPSSMIRSGLPSPDGKDHDGTKNFLLVSGYVASTNTFEKQYKNVWYTMCFPFNLTKDMLNNAFNPDFELCEFNGVTVNAESKSITLHFTDVIDVTDVDANDIVAKAYHPYMIHPNLGESFLNTPATCTFVGRNDVEPEEATEVGDGTNSILGQSVVKKSEAYEGVQGTFTFQGNVSSEKKVIPYGAYFLGTAEGQTYPKFWRESSKIQDRDRGLWSQYSAILHSDQVLEMKMFNNNTSAIDNYVKSFDIDFSDFNSEDALAIEKIVKEAEEKNLPVQYMNIVYDINGKLIQKGDASLENLPSGLYIVNGKKYLVK